MPYPLRLWSSSDTGSVFTNVGGETRLIITKTARVPSTSGDATALRFDDA
jgi:hypothetical protein